MPMATAHAAPMLCRAALAALGLLCAPTASAQQGGGEDAPPPAVVTETVQVRAINPPQTFVGRLEAVRVADLVARVPGFLEAVHFQEGADVAAGDLLYTIDDAEYRAAVRLAEASLASARAAAREAEVAFDRAEQLTDRGAVAQASLDEATATRDATAADVLGAEAELARAELDLSYATIRAPFAGRIGRTAYTEGDFIDLSSGSLARVIQMDPMRAVFSVSEVELVDAKLEFDTLTQAELNAVFAPRIVLPGGRDYPEPGEIDFISNEVDPQTGTVAVRALFPNPDGFLLQGQFVDVSVTRTEEEERPVVPIGALQRDREGPFVLGLGDGDVVERIAVGTGERLGTVWTIESGLEGGEVIVVEGLQKARAGEPVTPEERPAEVAENASGGGAGE